MNVWMQRGIIEQDIDVISCLVVGALRNCADANASFRGNRFEPRLAQRGSFYWKSGVLARGNCAALERVKQPYGVCAGDQRSLKTRQSTVNRGWWIARAYFRRAARAKAGASLRWKFEMAYPGQGGRPTSQCPRKPPRVRRSHRHLGLPQSSSASRLTAGAAGFLIFTQSRERPER